MKSRGRRQHHTARHFLGSDARQVQGRTLASYRLLDRLSVHLHSANAHSLTCGKDFQFVRLLNRATNQRSCDHRAESFHNEDPVNRQSCQRGWVFCRNFDRDFYQCLPEIIEARSGQRTDRDRRRLNEIQK